MSFPDLELLKSFKKNTEWFDNNYQSLQKYNGQFIAIYKENIIDSDTDYRKLVNRVKKLYDKSVYMTLISSRGIVAPAK
jgi:hypothetical protein